jgi:hypothetical protein
MALCARFAKKMQLVRGLTRMNADPDNPRESAFIRVPFSEQATCLSAPITMALCARFAKKMQLVRGLTRMNADPDNPRESAFIRVPFSEQPLRRSQPPLFAAHGAFSNASTSWGGAIGTRLATGSLGRLICRAERAAFPSSTL